MTDTSLSFRFANSSTKAFIIGLNATYTAGPIPTTTRIASLLVLIFSSSVFLQFLRVPLLISSITLKNLPYAFFDILTHPPHYPCFRKRHFSNNLPYFQELNLKAFSRLQQQLNINFRVSCRQIHNHACHIPIGVGLCFQLKRGFHDCSGSFLGNDSETSVRPLRRSLEQRDAQPDFPCSPCRCKRIRYPCKELLFYSKTVVFHFYFQHTVCQACTNPHLYAGSSRSRRVLDDIKDMQ